MKYFDTTHLHILLKTGTLKAAIFFSTLALFISCNTGQSKTDSVLEQDIALARKRVSEVTAQMAQYSGLASFEPLVRIRYLIALQTLDMLEQRKSAAFYNIEINYQVNGKQFQAERDLYEKDIALQEARAKAVTRLSLLETLRENSEGLKLTPLTWERHLLALTVTQIDYRLAALRYQFPDVIGDKLVEQTLNELVKKYPSNFDALESISTIAESNTNHPSETPSSLKTPPHMDSDS